MEYKARLIVKDFTKQKGYWLLWHIFSLFLHLHQFITCSYIKWISRLLSWIAISKKRFIWTSQKNS